MVQDSGSTLRNPRSWRIGGRALSRICYAKKSLVSFEKKSGKKQRSIVNQSLRISGSSPLKIYRKARHPTSRKSLLRTVLEEYVQQTREVLNELLRAVWESLELEQSIMEDSLQLKSSNQILVGNLFPPCPQSELVLGFPPHTDATLLSLLVQNNSFNALQVMHDGKWVVVDLMPPTLLILPGDFMEIVSNGRYKSTLHRVVVSNEHTRISVGTSISPPFEGVFIAPAPELLRSSNNPAMFRSVTFKEYVTLKRNKNLTDSILDLLKL